MDKETEKLYIAAREAARQLALGNTSYDKAIAIVKQYTDHANIKAKQIAKRFGMKPKEIDPRGFLR